MSWDSREVNFWYPGENKKGVYQQSGAGNQCGRGAENILERGWSKKGWRFSVFCNWAWRDSVGMLSNCWWVLGIEEGGRVTPC